MFDGAVSATVYAKTGGELLVKFIDQRWSAHFVCGQRHVS
jgi:hypothetical protein